MRSIVSSTSHLESVVRCTVSSSIPKARRPSVFYWQTQVLLCFEILCQILAPFVGVVALHTMNYHSIRICWRSFVLSMKVLPERDIQSHCSCVLFQGLHLLVLGSGATVTLFRKTRACRCGSANWRLRRSTPLKPTALCSCSPRARAGWASTSPQRTR